MEVATILPIDQPMNLAASGSAGYPLILGGHPEQGADRDFAALYSRSQSLTSDNIKPYEGPGKHITLDIHWGSSSPPLRMSSVLGLPYQSDRPWRAVNSRRICESVIRADLEVHGGQTVDVALKYKVGFDARDDLVNEARFYCRELSELQNKVVPYYIGIFCVETPRKRYTLPLVRTIMVLTWVGERLPTSIQDMPAVAR
jgi:hypothetical protein